MFYSLVRESVLCPEATKQSWYNSSPDSFSVLIASQFMSSKSYCSVICVSTFRSKLNSLICQESLNADHKDQHGCTNCQRLESSCFLPARPLITAPRRDYNGAAAAESEQKHTRKSRFTPNTLQNSKAATSPKTTQSGGSSWARKPKTRPWKSKFRGVSG